MGKIKRGRQKFHTAAAVKETSNRSTKQNDKVEIVDMMDTEGQFSGKPMSTVGEDSNIFKGVNISKKSLMQELPDFDTKSTITSKSMKGLQLKKKDKRKLRHNLMLKKLGDIETAKKEAKERKRKQQTPVVGDIGLLGEALPTLDLLLKGSTSHKQGQSQQKPRSIPKEKQRKKQMLQDIAVFQQVFKHPSYQENPTATITEHLHNKLKQDNEMDT